MFFFFQPRYFVNFLKVPKDIVKSNSLFSEFFGDLTKIDGNMLDLVNLILSTFLNSTCLVIILLAKTYK